MHEEAVRSSNTPLKRSVHALAARIAEAQSVRFRDQARRFHQGEAERIAGEEGLPTPEDEVEARAILAAAYPDYF